jgi:hypothetical protein
MEIEDKERASSARASESNQELAVDSPVLFVRNVARMFQDLNRGHHKKLYEFIAASAVTFVRLSDDAAAWKLFKEEQFWDDCGRTPKGLTKSNDVLIYLTDAVTRDAIRQAGKYARVVDYMISKNINDYEAYLNRLGYEKILEAARSDQPNGRAQGWRWPYVKVYIHPRAFESLGLILGNCPENVEFELACRAGPGSNSIVTGHCTPVTKIDQFPESELEVREYRKRLPKMVLSQKKLAKEAESLASQERRVTAKGVRR